MNLQIFYFALLLTTLLLHAPTVKGKRHLSSALQENGPDPASDGALLRGFIANVSGNCSFKSNWFAAAAANPCAINSQGIECNGEGVIVGLTVPRCNFPGPLNFSSLPKSLLKLTVLSGAYNGTMDLTHLPASLQVLHITAKQMSGPVNLTRLPASLQSLNLSTGMLNSILDLTRLPNGLQSLRLNGNKFSGSVDLTQLPDTLLELHLQSNQFNSTAALYRLPPSLVYLDLSNNQFGGLLDLTNLPSNLQTLDLSNNKFTYSLDLTSLTSSLRSLSIKSNQFSGSLDLTALPAQLETLTMTSNQFSGSLNLTSLPDSLLSLDISSNQFSGFLNLSALPNQLQTITLINNRFSGPLVLTTLPSTLHALDLSNNAFEGPLSLAQLNASLETLKINNILSLNQSLDLGNLPSSLKNLDLSSNQFSGELTLSGVPESLATNGLVLSGNKFTKLNLDSFSGSFSGMINLASNDLIGPLDLTKFSGSIGILDLSNNEIGEGLDCSFSGTIDNLLLNNNKLTMLKLANFSGSITSIDFSSNTLNSIDFANGGDFLEILTITENSAPISSIDFTTLPQSLGELYLDNSQVSGFLQLSNLPPALRYLSLSNNNLDGSLDLSHLSSISSSAAALIIDLSNNILSGPLDLSVLPENTVASLILSDNQFEGLLNVSRLGHGLGTLDLKRNRLDSLTGFGPNCSLASLDLSSNAFNGPIDFRHLPSSLQTLALTNNHFNGSADFSNLPASIKTLSLSHNDFSGSVELTMLPSSLTGLYMANNQLGGSVNLGQLPGSIKELDLSNNGFVGSVDLDHLPTSLTSLKLSNNSLEGTIRTDLWSPLLGTLSLDTNQFHGSVELLQIPIGLKELNLSSNAFVGIVNLTNVTVQSALVKLDLSNNQFTDLFANITLKGESLKLSLMGNPWECPIPKNPSWLAPLVGSCIAMCALPTPLSVGYLDHGQCQNRILEENCVGISCAPGFLGTANVSCNGTTRIFELEGCSPPPTCATFPLTGCGKHLVRTLSLNRTCAGFTCMAKECCVTATVTPTNTATKIFSSTLTRSTSHSNTLTQSLTKPITRTSTATATGSGRGPTCANFTCGTSLMRISNAQTVPCEGARCDEQTCCIEPTAECQNAIANFSCSKCALQVARPDGVMPDTLACVFSLHTADFRPLPIAECPPPEFHISPVQALNQVETLPLTDSTMRISFQTTSFLGDGTILPTSPDGKSLTPVFALTVADVLPQGCGLAPASFGSTACQQSAVCREGQVFSDGICQCPLSGAGQCDSDGMCTAVVTDCASRVSISSSRTRFQCPSAEAVLSTSLRQVSFLGFETLNLHIETPADPQTGNQYLTLQSANSASAHQLTLSGNAGHHVFAISLGGGEGSLHTVVTANCQRCEFLISISPSVASASATTTTRFESVSLTDVQIQSKDVVWFNGVSFYGKASISTKGVGSGIVIEGESVGDGSLVVEGNVKLGGAQKKQFSFVLGSKAPRFRSQEITGNGFSATICGAGPSGSGGTRIPSDGRLILPLLCSYEGGPMQGGSALTMEPFSTLSIVEIAGIGRPQGSVPTVDSCSWSTINIELDAPSSAANGPQTVLLLRCLASAQPLQTVNFVGDCPCCQVVMYPHVTGMLGVTVGCSSNENGNPGDPAVIQKGSGSSDGGIPPGWIALPSIIAVLCGVGIIAVCVYYRWKIRDLTRQQLERMAYHVRVPSIGSDVPFGPIKLASDATDYLERLPPVADWECPGTPVCSPKFHVDFTSTGSAAVAGRVLEQSQPSSDR